MGIFGSKEKLGQIAVIYGYNQHELAWKDIDTRSIYHTSGIIVNYNEKKFIITTRSRLISCQNIVMYHCYFNDEEPIMKNNLEILFQSIEYNIIILGTKGHNELILSASENLYGSNINNDICPSIDINKLKYIKPSKRTVYHTIIMNIDLESRTIKYNTDIYDVKYQESIIYDRSYIPDNFMYQFKIDSVDANLIGICGSPIFNRNHELVGIITKTENKNLYVLPTKALNKIIRDFNMFYNCPMDYLGPLTIPFTYDIIKNIALIEDTCNILTIDGITTLNTNDKIISIGLHDMIIKDDMIKIYDPDYKEYIPLEIYLNINLEHNIPINLSVMRKKKILNINVIGTKMDNILLLTDESYYHPKFLIPYINYNDLIIVQLTQELIDVMTYHKAILRNKIIDDFMENSNLQKNCLLILDCLNDNLSKKHILTKLTLKERQVIACPYIISINGDDVKTLAKLESILSKTNKIKIAIQYYNEKEYVI